MELGDKYPSNPDPYRDMEAPWLLYHVFQMMRALNHRFVIPQAANRRVSYMFYDKYKHLHEQRNQQNAGDDSDEPRPDKAP